MTQVFLECTCPPGYVAAAGAHQPGCTHENIDAAVRCAPGSGCCTEDHDHGAAANACPAAHDGAACPEPDVCRVWKGAIADASHPLSDGSHPLYEGTTPPPCPGGHCHKDVDGCTVCRPLIITVLPGTTITTAR
jgi:hypothetical protein